MLKRIRAAAAVLAAALTLLTINATTAQGAPATWTEIDAVGGQIYDVDADRILFAQSADQLALKDRRTEDVTPITAIAGEQPVAGFLSPHGAIFQTQAGIFGGRALYEWRDGALVPLGPIESLSLVAFNNFSLAVTGDFAIWNSVQGAGTMNPTNPLYRRDLASGTTVEVAPSTSGWGDHDLGTDALRPANDVAANGDVVFSGNGVERYRNGVTQTISPAAQFAIYPRTDETSTVAWTSADCCPGASAGSSPSGQFALGTLDRRPSADLDYAVEDGWAAFTDAAAGGVVVKVRSPAGVTTAVSPPGDYRIVALGSDGNVVYGTFQGPPQAVAFLGRPGEDPVPLGTIPVRRDASRGYGDHVFQRGGRWYNAAGGSLRRLTLTDAPTDGSDTAIDSGPPAADESTSAAFAFSSPTPGATFQTRLDGGAWEATAAASKAYTDLSEGEHVFLVRAVKSNGDVDPEPASQTWTVDTTAPALTLETPSDGGAVADSTPELAGQAGDTPGDGPDVVADIYEGTSASGTPVRTLTIPRSGATWSGSPATALPDGLYTAVASQADAAGNSTTSTPHTFRVDTTPPAPFSLQTPTDGAENRSPNVPLIWERASDEGSGVDRYELWIDGAKNGELTDSSCATEACGRAPAQPLAEGLHTWQVKAFDLAGNERVSATHSFSVEAAPPAPFGLLSPADGQRVGDPGPVLRWEPTTDAGSGLAHYDVWIDGQRLAGALESPEWDIPITLPDGSHSWRVEAIDEAGNARSSAERTFVVDTAPPVADLDVTPNPVLTRSPVTLDASASSDPAGGRIIRHEWDFDGDGTFGSDTGPTPTATTAYPRRGQWTPAVRVTDEAGNVATATTPVEARPAPPAGAPGVSIEGGARFTNSPRVTVDVVWPPFATDIVFSNDGGFGGATPRPVGPRMAWRLDSSGPERLPKTIYARFQGIDGRETYQDDIIVDQTDPKLLAVRLDRVKRRTARLRLTARDGLSGVARMQLAASRPFPRRSVRFRRVTRVSALPPHLSVRVRDRAGNWSKWRRATRR